MKKSIEGIPMLEMNMEFENTASGCGIEHFPSEGTAFGKRKNVLRKQSAHSKDAQSLTARKKTNNP